MTASVYDRLHALHMQLLKVDVKAVAIRLDRKSLHEFQGSYEARFDFGANKHGMTWRDMLIIEEHLYRPMELYTSASAEVPVNELVEAFPTVISIEAKLRANGRTVYFDDPDCDPRILATAEFYSSRNQGYRDLLDGH